ncbi:F510_1955 family glycosylhydrolase [Aquibacillus salsiterrae]|uniref:Glycosyl hydrolase n=1 Tax=Aquibacillus salsiterrae TaxID=2950439 RepID=A0A9X3WJD6_9BACI|nr:hypothetical protein [Aquibacillus salsiterrae]MDC3418141.1 hypothetical protein [Aquibacillus salsiterrae]
MKNLPFLVILLFIVPLRAFADGSEGEHAQEVATNYWSYGLVASVLILIVCVGLYVWTKRKASSIGVKNKEDRELRKVLLGRATIYLWVAIAAVAATIVFLVLTNGTGSNDQAQTGKVNFPDVHGLGYSNDGEEIYVPAHDGLKVYKDGKWAPSTTSEANDYMGFSMFKDGFYSSGHPGPGSDLANPLGIIRSTDMGENMEVLDLYKEIDFHGMTVGYETEDIYVFNPSENSRMDQPGFFYSSDETKTWNQAKLVGLEGQATALAAHPTESGKVALGTKQGVYLSDNYGDDFQALAIQGPVTAVSFDFQGNLLVATAGGDLVQLNIASNETNQLVVPDLAEDVILYIQQNPVNKDELTFVTAEKDIYHSYDGGKTWEQSADKGVALE